MVRTVYHIHREQPTEASKIYGGVKESHRELQWDRIDTRGANTTPRRDCADRLLDDAPTGSLSRTLARITTYPPMCQQHSEWIVGNSEIGT